MDIQRVVKECVHSVILMGFGLGLFYFCQLIGVLDIYAPSVKIEESQAEQIADAMLAKQSERAIRRAK